MTIVTLAYRPKRTRKRKTQAPAIGGPTIVTAKSKRTHRQVADVVASGTGGHRHCTGPSQGPMRATEPGETPFDSDDTHAAASNAA
jgi:hypothetical protein